MSFRIKLLITVFSLLFFLVGVLTLKDYGMNWDEPEHYMRGQAFLRFYLSGEKDYNNLQRTTYRKSFFQNDSEGGRFTFSSYINNAPSHPPLNGILAAFSNFILYQKLGIMGDIDSYHFFILVVSVILAFVVFYFTSEAYGFFPGLIAFLSLILYPLFFAESHFNIKDPVEASFFSLTILLFYTGIVKKNWRLIILSSIFGGCALGTKFNAFFIIPILFLWVAVYKGKDLMQRTWPFPRNVTYSLIAFPFVSALVFFIFFPNLWTHPTAFLDSLRFYKTLGYGTVYQQKQYLTFFNINLYPVLWVLYSTPITTLFFSIAGIVYALHKGFREKEKTSLLILIWFVVSIVRVSAPNVGIYGGVRQIMEYIPALAILSGIGVGYIVSFLRTKQTIRRVPLLVIELVILLMFFPIALKLISIHPNENVYLNPLIGGLKGAKEKDFPDWGTTLGSVYQQGVVWLNNNAEYNANLALIKGFQSNIPRIKIREDINFHEKYYSGENKKGEYLMEVIDSNWDRDIPYEKRSYLETLIPVYEVKVDGVTILSVWKNDQKHTKSY